MISEKEFKECRARMEVIIAKGAELGDMELLSEEDKAEYILLSKSVAEYEDAYYPLPGRCIYIAYWHDQGEDEREGS